MGLTQRKYDGSFYCVTESTNEGAVFRMTGDGTLTSLVSFNGTNGASPVAALVEGSDGNFYGTTYGGGTSYISPTNQFGYGTIFKMTFNGRLTPLYSFTGFDDGAYPNGLIQGTDGNFYGTTREGGANNAGTVFKMTANGSLTTLYSFTGENDGYAPVGGLVQASDGNFYGTTYGGGTNDVLNDGDGTVFRITTNGTLTTLVSFNGVNGAGPITALVQGSDGILYGTTSYGGMSYDGSQDSGYGTIYIITTNGAFTTLDSLDSTNGNLYSGLVSALVQGVDGDFYYVSGSGGEFGSGGIFRMSFGPPPPAPMFQSVTQSGTQISFVWNSIPGRRYQIQYTTELSPGNWSNLGNPILATNSTASGFDFSQRFYRVVLLP